MQKHMRSGAKVRRGMPVWMILAAVLSAGGCDDGADPTGPGPGQPAPPVASVVVDPPAATLGVGDTVRLRAVVRSAAGDTLVRGVVWSSTNPERATVSGSGLVTAHGAGTVVIRASSGGRSGLAALTVEDPAPPVTPVVTAIHPSEVAAGGPPLTLRIFGTGFEPQVRVHWNGAWRPSERVSETELRALLPAEDVAEVGTMLVRVVNPVGGRISDPVPLQIVPQTNPVAAVTVHPALAFTTVGSAVPVATRLYDGAGQPLSNRYVTWESSNHLVATVDGQGLVRPVGVGEVVITARSEGVEANSVVRVKSGEHFHMLASDGVGLATLDLRLGTPPSRIWEHGPSSRAIQPSPSPDGRFAAYVIESTLAGPDDPQRLLAVFDVTMRTYLFVSDLRVADQPAWSPAGDRIAFRGAVDGRSYIFTVRPDGTNLVNLTGDLPAESSAFEPAWSPDGSRIVFAVRSDPGFHGLMIMNSDGSGKRNLTGGAIDTQPTWIGDVVVFTRRDPFGTATDIWRTSVSGLGPLMPLTATGTAHSPALSPDHGWIAYIDGAEEGPGALMAMRPFGEDVRAIHTPGPGEPGLLDPAWVVRW